MRTFKTHLLAVLAFFCVTAHSFDLSNGQFNLSLGGAYVYQGQEQLIDIKKTFGNIHTVTHQDNMTFLAGAGYLLNAFERDTVNIALGASIYYLSPAKVEGVILVERTFPNLAYQYKTTNSPLYAEAKAVWQSQNVPVALVIDAGVGPNFIRTEDYYERSADGGVTIPNQAFQGERTVKLSAMAGIGLRFNQVFSDNSLEVGYKYFYLNEGKLNPKPQVLNHLKTANINAHALTLTLVA